MTKEIEEEKPFRTKPQTVKRDRHRQAGNASWLAQMFGGIVKSPLSGSSDKIYDGFGRFRDGHKGQQARAVARRRRGNQIARMSRRVNRQRAA